MQHDRPRPMPLQVVAQAQLLDEPDGVRVALEEVVIELLEPRAVRSGRLESPGQAAGHRLALQDRHLVPTLRQPQRGGQAQRTRAQDGDASAAHGAVQARIVAPGPSYTGTKASASVRRWRRSAQQSVRSARPSKRALGQVDVIRAPLRQPVLHAADRCRIDAALQRPVGGDLLVKGRLAQPFRALDGGHRAARREEREPLGVRISGPHGVRDHRQRCLRFQVGVHPRHGLPALGVERMQGRTGILHGLDRCAGLNDQRHAPGSQG